MRRFLSGRSGSVAAISALLLPFISGTVVFGLDHMRATQQVGAMQKAADAAALASVRQLAFVLTDEAQDNDAPQGVGVPSDTMTAIASGLVKTTLDGDLPQATTLAEIVDGDSVRVSVTARYGSIFGELGAFGENPFTVYATAKSFGGQNVCFIALGSDPDSPGIELEDSAELKGETCEIYSSSKRTDSVAATGSSRMAATLICSAGGFDGPIGNFSTPPTTDCPQIEDPLIARKAPPFDAECDEGNLTLDGGTHTLEPGTYCGKTDIKNGADVWMNPGIYVFSGGELHVHDTGRLRGTGIGLYFDDDEAFFRFMDKGEVDLSAPTKGPMAGMLVASRPTCKDSTKTVPCQSGRQFSITSSNVRSLLGTIHLPNDELTVDTTMPVSGEAAFTIVVVGRLNLKQSPTLVLNTDYDATDVPVPPGFQNSDNTVPRLVQ